MDIRKQRILLGWTIVFFWASEYCHVPYFSPYLQTLGFASEVIGFITGFYGFTQLLIRIPLGVVTDATSGYKKAIVMGTVFTTLSSFCLVYAKSALAIILCRIMAGFAASTWLVFTILYSAMFSQDEGVKAMTQVNAYCSGGRFLAFVLGMFASTVWDIKMPLWFSVWTGLVAIVLALFVQQVPIKREPFRISHAVEVFFKPAILAASFFGIAMQAVTQGTVYSFTSTILRGMGAKNYQMGLASMLFTLIQVILAPYVGKRLKGIRRTVSIPLGLYLFVVSILLAGYAKGVWPIYLANLIGGIANMILISLLLSMVASAVTEEKRATAMGIYQALYGIGMTMGPNLVGKLIAAYSISTAYTALAAMVLLVALVSPVILRLVEKRP